MACDSNAVKGPILNKIFQDVPTGKDSVVKALTEYNSGTAKGGNPVLELVEVVKARQAAGQAVLIWTHKRSAGCHDIPQALEAALTKGGVDLSRQIMNPFSRRKESVPQVRVQNFGQHDATNKYSYCDVVVLFGVQRRQLGDISAAILGADRALGGKLKYKDAYSARAGEAAVVAQQAIGRGRSRITSNGKAGRQDTLLFFAEDQEFNITARLKRVFRSGVDRVQAGVCEGVGDLGGAVIEGGFGLPRQPADG